MRLAIVIELTGNKTGVLMPQLSEIYRIFNMKVLRKVEEG